MQLPKRLRRLCKEFNLDPEDIVEILDEPEDGDDSDYMVRLFSSTLPYVTLGSERVDHVSYEDAMAHTANNLQNEKKLSIYCNGVKVEEVPYHDTMEVGDLVIVQGISDMKQTTCRDLVTCKTTRPIDYIMDGSGQKYRQVYPIRLNPENVQSIWTPEKPLTFVTIHANKVIFTVPQHLIENKSAWTNPLHRTLLKSHEKREIAQGIRPIVFPNIVKVFTLIPMIGGR